MRARLRHSTAAATVSSENVGLVVSLATRATEVRAAQALRFRVFAEEMGAQLHGPEVGIDCDYFDAYCHHLLVHDQATGEVVAYTRILTDTQAKRAGGFYSESEFDLCNIRRLPGRVMEIGRTCVHPDYRNGAAIAVLWSGLAQFMESNRFDYLIGCASIPLTQDHTGIGTLYQQLASKHLSADSWRVAPKRPLPSHWSATEEEETAKTASSPSLPPLLKAYMRLGAEICGAPCWDPDFKVADLFILMAKDRMNPRYARHFLARSEAQPDQAFKVRHFPRAYPGYPGRPRWNMFAALKSSFSHLKPKTNPTQLDGR